MKKTLVSLILLALALSACGPASVQPTREQQLSEIGLFGLKALKGVAEKDSFSGEFSGGFFLFAGGARGEISSSSILTLKWYPFPNQFIYTDISRSKFVIIESPGLETPQIEFKFKQEWLDGAPNSWTEYEIVFVNDHDIVIYHEGAKANLNNFLKDENLDVVYIHIDPAQLEPESE